MYSEAFVESPRRKIIHCDCDCFYAAVEMRDDPSLRSVPLAVGGTGGRGVVATCNYRARQFGVRSAMPMGEARRLCPDLVTVPTDMPRYKAVSQQVMAIFKSYTELVEPLSLDEAYLDVSHSTQCQGSATLIAQEIRQRVRDEVGITVSAGVAPNKFLAKIASDWRKPDGLFVITPAEVDHFVQDLPVEALHGVGQVTAGKLHEMGIRTCGDLRNQDRMKLVERFGKQGYRLSQLAWGEDERAVKVSRERKSVSVERTFEQNLPSLAACEAVLAKLWDNLQGRLQRYEDDKPFHKVFVKIRFADFTTQTQERVLQPRESLAPEAFQPLLQALYEQRESDREVRLLGIGVRFREIGAPATQLRLFE
ncbi:DNA polymerase IV [Marinobacteraceae bacterium S3BR75-40.1]